MNYIHPVHGSHGHLLIVILNKWYYIWKKNSFTWTKQNNSKNKHKLNIIINKIKSNKISINKQNYKNNYRYLTLGCKGLGKQDVPQDHNIMLFISVLSWQPEYKVRFITIVLKTCTITQKHRLHIELLISHLLNILMVKIVLWLY